jgi:hypothetical protein
VNNSRNPSKNGMVVNGDHVTGYGVAIEHHLEDGCATPSCFCVCQLAPMVCACLCGCAMRVVCNVYFVYYVWFVYVCVRGHAYTCALVCLCIARLRVDRVCW